jgi:hypothetical protein
MLCGVFSAIAVPEVFSYLNQWDDSFVKWLCWVACRKCDSQEVLNDRCSPRTFKKQEFGGPELVHQKLAV